MNRVRNYLFSAAAAVVLCSCLGNAAVLAVTVGEDAPVESYLEGRQYQLRPDLSATSFSDHTYQDQMEQYLADRVPGRDTALLACARIQDMSITCANAAFGFPARHSFYGSEYLVAPEYDAIVETPTSQEVASPEFIADRLSLYDKAISKHENVNWAFALVDRSRISETNPAHDLVSQPADYAYYQERFLSKLPESCQVIDLSIADPERYFELFFHTDHHWQVNGALEAYKKIMAVFGKQPRDVGETSVIYDGPFYGSEARSGLLVRYSDWLVDIEHNKPEWTLEVDGKAEDLRWLNEGFDRKSVDYEPTQRFSNAYAEYFHGDCGRMHIHNPEGHGSLLIIGDSFTNNIDYLFAYTYKDVHNVDPRHFEGEIDELLAEVNPDDAVFLMASNTVLANSTARFLR